MIADDDGEVGNEVGHQATVRAERVDKLRAPAVERRLVERQNLANEVLERRGHGRIGDIALVLVELAAREQAGGPDRRLLQFADQGGLADPGGTGQQNEFCPPRLCDAAERLQQPIELGGTAVKAFGDQQTVRPIVLCEGERRDVPAILPILEAVAKVGLDGADGLVAVLSPLLQELEHDGFEHRREAGDALAGRDRRSGDVGMNPVDRFDRVERQCAGEHLVERHAEAVEIAALVDRTVHVPGLLGRHVGERPAHQLRRRRRETFPLQPARVAKPRKPDLPRRLSEHVRRSDALVDKAALVHPPDGRHDTDRECQERARRHRGAEQPRQRHAARIGKNEYRPTPMVAEFQRHGRPRRVELLRQGVLVLEALETGGGGLL